MAREIFHFPKVDSTNQIALDLGRKGYPEGTLVIAEEQTAGRGRWRRRWHSPPGKSLLFSIILRPQIPPEFMPQLTLLAGVSTARAIQLQTGIKIGIKWPNDLIYQGKKLCGILVERAGLTDPSLVLGIGVNVNQEKDDFSPELQDTATSLRMIAGEIIPRAPLLQQIVESLEEDYQEYCRAGFPPIRKRWLQYEVILGKKVRIAMGNSEYWGKAIGLSENGELVVLSPQGEETKFAAGEVTLCREE